MCVCVCCVKDYFQERIYFEKKKNCKCSLRPLPLLNVERDFELLVIVIRIIVTTMFFSGKVIVNNLRVIIKKIRDE